MVETSDNQPEFEDLIDRYLDQLRTGSAPSVENFASEWPEHAEQLRELLPTLLAMEDLAPNSESFDIAAQEAEVERFGNTDFRQLGDYRIIREIGRGGMGIVYEAEQMSLRRHVALKVLPSGGLDERFAERFQREARAAAKLHHTNIVPVYDVGEQDGTLFFAMQYIRGAGLDAVIAEMRRLGADAPPHAATDTSAAMSSITSLANTMSEIRRPEDSETDTQWKSIAAVGRQAASALEYAHQRGILHRDIKPANLLLDQHGHVWIADFGLAKTDDQNNLTQSGDIIGTLRYMAPESFEGESSVRSEVYALGMTLYELVAQRPAFHESNRYRLIYAVTHNTPIALKSIARGIPRDLENIILKAIDREPRTRYATAGELSADLDRFLHNEPVHAHRLSAAERLLRWAKRNRAIAASLVTIFTLLVTGLVMAVLTAEYFREQEGVQKRLAIRNQSLAESNEQRRAEAVEARDAQVVARRQSQKLSARLSFDAAMQMMQRGEIPQGMHKLVDCLRIAPEDDFEFNRIVRTNLTGWSRRLLRPVRRQLYRVNASFGGLTLSPDGQTLAYASPRDPQIAEQTIVLSDALTGVEKHRLDAGLRNPHALSFSPDGRYLACGRGSIESTIKRAYVAVIWETATGKLVHQLPCPATVSAVAWHPDGVQFFAAAGRTVRAWNIVSGEPIGESLTVGEDIDAIALSPDGQFLAVGFQSGRVKSVSSKFAILELATGDVVASDLLSGTRCRSIGWSGNGRSFFAHGTLYDWNPASAEIINGSKIEEASRISFSQDGLMIASSASRNTLHLRSGGGRADSRFPNGGNFPTMSHDGRYLLTSTGFWTLPDIPDCAYSRSLDVPGGKEDDQPPHRYRFPISNDNRMMLITSAKEVNKQQLWMLDQPLPLPTSPTFPPGRAVFSPDDTLIVLWDHVHQMVRLFETATGRQVGSTISLDGQPTDVRVSPDNRWLAVIIEDRIVNVWSLASEDEEPAFEFDERNGLRGFDFNCQSTLLAVAGRFSTRVFEVSSWNEIQQDGSTSAVDGIRPVFLPMDEEILLVCKSGTAKFVNAREGSTTGAFIQPPDVIESIILNHEGSRAATTNRSKSEVRLWDVTTGQPVGRPMEANGTILHISFSPDDSMLVIGNDKSIKIWDTKTSLPVSPTFATRNRIHRLAWSPDNSAVVTIHRDFQRRIHQIPRPANGTNAEIARTVRTLTAMEVDNFGQAIPWSPKGQAAEGGSPDSPIFDRPNFASRLDDGEWHLARALDCLTLRDPDSAITHLNQAVIVNPDIWQPYAHRARLHAISGDVEAAANDRLKAVAQGAPKELISVWARDTVSEGMPERALQLWQHRGDSSRHWFAGDWVVAGPYLSKLNQLDFDWSELSVDAKEQTDVQWHRFHAPYPAPRPNHQMPLPNEIKLPDEPVLVYLHKRIYANEPADVSLSSSELELQRCRIWLNNKVVHAPVDNTTGTLALKLNLVAGWNDILVKTRIASKSKKVQLFKLN